MQAANSSAPLIEIYTGTYCSYCHRAKALLARKGVAFSEFDVGIATNHAVMSARLPSARTIPQVFIDGEHVGGFDDLQRLDAQGDLDRMLGRADRQSGGGGI